MTGAAQANLETLYRIFTIPEQPDSTLGAIDQAITRDVTAFLRTHIVNIERSLEEIEQDFLAARVPEEPTYVSDYTEFVKDKLVAHSVHTASPGFVGHMTSALPNFMLPLSRILVALNQNLVKVETSKAFTPLERQVLAMLHHLIYNRDESFYQDCIHDSSQALGACCSGGTIANCTALWAARNQLLKPRGNFGGLAQEGLFKALQFLDCEGLAVLVSRRAHYSLSKAVDLLGLGRDNLVLVDTDDHNRIDLGALQRSYQELRSRNIRPLALVGIAGTTETGHIDPLEQLADFAAEIDCHFHVDAAWGGPTLFSDRHRALLRGIERADSVTFDAHKQLYVPMGSGMVLFRDPQTATAIEHHANYILRPGSKDLGSHTLEGSRPGQALLVHAGLSIIGRKGYELLIDLGIERARQFAALIEAHPDFELISAPQLNILTYRYCPAWLQQVFPELPEQISRQLNELLDELVTRVQKQQREAGQTFVSRTRLRSARYPETEQLSVFRSVLANPLTTEEILHQVLSEQIEIVAREEFRPLLKQLQSLARGGESSLSTSGDSD